MVALGLVGAALGVTAAVRPQEAQLEAQSEEATGFGVTLATDRPAYGPGEPVRMLLTAFNRAEEELTLHFNTAQRFDFVILDGSGEEVFRWSKGKLFAQVLGSETLGPDRPELSFTAELTAGLSPGSYQVQGLIVSEDRPLSAELAVLVR